MHRITAVTKRVHIVGPPRSGTTLALQLMSAGFSFSGVADTERSLLLVRGSAPGPLARRSRLLRALRRRLSDRLSRLDRAPSVDVEDEHMFCSKSPQDHRLVRHVIDQDELLWFISMVRDPRDVVVSRHRARPGVYWANLRQWKAWHENTRAYRDHPRLIEVRYEELVRDPDGVQEELARRLPFLTQARRFSECHTSARPSRQSRQALGGVRAVDRRSVGNWRSHLPRLAGQLRIHGPITRELIELGYEPDDSWTSELEGIELDTRPGRWPEFPSPRRAERIREEIEIEIPAYLRTRGVS